MMDRSVWFLFDLNILGGHSIFKHADVVSFLGLTSFNLDPVVFKQSVIFCSYNYFEDW